MTARKLKSGWDTGNTEASHSHTTVVESQYILVRHSHPWSPPTDVFEANDRLMVLIEISGMQNGKFNVVLDELHLTVSGNRSAPHHSKVAFHQIEVRHGEFRVDLTLPWAIDEQQVEASYEDGFLRIILPKLKAQDVHVVDVEKKSDTD